MVGGSFFTGFLPGCSQRERVAHNKETDVAEHPQAFDHVGLLFNKPPGRAELPFV
jgi:hypothetical protein